MSSRTIAIGGRIGARVGAALLFATAALAQGAPNNIVVHTALGGFVLGYDIDQNGTEGILAEGLTLANGNHDVAIETFDQATGAIVKIVRKQLNSKNDFVCLGVVGTSVGLVEYEHVSNIFVDHRRYAMLNPLGGNAFTKIWSPPLTVNDLIESVSDSQGAPGTAFLAFNNGGSFQPYLFESNVAANTFGSKIPVPDGEFAINASPVMALDSAHHRAVVAGSFGCPFCQPKLATFDLASGAENAFAGLGFGLVNGIAVDSNTGTACTTTEIDFSVEFYDLATQNGIIITLPGATNQAQSGGYVAVDPQHKLFLVQQEFSSTAPTGSSLQVFDEQGAYVESIDGLLLPASPVRIALKPSVRKGFVLTTPALTTLQGFDY